MSKKEVHPGWIIEDYGGTFSPVLEGEKEGVSVEIDKDDDLAVEFDDERKSGYIPMKAIHALIEANTKFLKDK